MKALARMTDPSGPAADTPRRRSTARMHLVAAGGVAGPSAARGRLPDPRPLTHRLAQAIAEVLAGARPASQLSSHATLHVIRLLERNSGRLNTRTGGASCRPIVGSVHLGEPIEGVVEACAVIDTGRRKRALALRLEAGDGGWRCTAVHVG